MREGWKEVEIIDFAEIVGGGTPSTKIDDYWNGDIPWITPNDLSNHTFKYIERGERNITDLGLAKSSAKLHPKNTILLTSRAPIGYLALAKNQVSTNQGFQSIRCNPEKADPNFIYYSLKVYMDKVKALASGATFPEVSGKKVGKVKLPLPPLPTQQRIAEILSGYDDLIENNLKRIKILEEMAQQTYEEWFVRMRFPGHELAVINPDTGLPEGWEKVKLGDVIKLNYGKALKQENRIEGIYNVYGSSGVVGTHNNYLVDGPSLIVGRKGNVGSVFYESKPFYPIDTVYYVTSNYSLFFLYYTIKGLSFVNNDAVVPGLNRDAAYFKEIVLPTKDLIEKFHVMCSNNYNLIFNLQNQNQRLREARDILLPRLMIGMIAVEK